MDQAIVRDLFTPQEVREMLAECDAIHRGEYGELYGGAFQIEPVGGTLV